MALSRVVSGQGNELAQQAELPRFNFLLVRDDTELRTIQRQPPPPPEIQQHPETSDLAQEAADMDALVDIEMPTLTPQQVKLETNLRVSVSRPHIEPGAVGMALVNQPRVMHRIPPRYPRKALRRRLEGQVVVEFVVLADGQVKAGSVKIIESTPAGVFEDTVLNSIKNWRFQVRHDDGVAVAYRARQALVFRLGK